MTKLKRIPKFATEAAKPTTTPISIRLPETLLLELKRLANERDVPYQSLMKVYLAERVAAERGWQGPGKRLQPAKVRRRRPRKPAAK